MTNNEISALLALRAQVEAMAQQIDSMLGWREMGVPVCAHEKPPKLAPGSSMGAGNQQWICPDCGEEVPEPGGEL